MKFRRLAVLFVVSGVALGWSLSRQGWPHVAPSVLAVLAQLDPDPACGRGPRQWAALVQGRRPERQDCLRRLVSGWRSQDLLTRLALDARRDDAVRLRAFGALADADALDPATQEGLLRLPATPPALRRSALARLREVSGGADAEDDARGMTVHGLADDATLALAARGEPGELLAAWRAARAIPTTRGVFAALGVTEADVRAGRLPLRGREAVEPATLPCLPDCDERARAALLALARARGEEPGPPQRPVAVSDGLLDLLADGEDADHLREELHGAAAWIGQQRDRSRALLDAVAHTDARAERAGPHGVLRNGAGSPGATALVARVLAAEASIDVEVLGWDGGVMLRTSQAARIVPLCGSPRQVAHVPRDAVRLSPTEVGISAALEAAAAALAAGRVDGARALLAYATTGPAPAAPHLARALATLEAVVSAASGPGEAGDAVTSSRFAPLDATLVRAPGRRKPAPQFDRRPEQAAAVAEHAAQVAAAAPDDTALALAAWWAAVGGHRDLARALAPLGAPDPAGMVARGAARLSGEPVGQADLARLADPGTLACAPPYLPWPATRR